MQYKLLLVDINPSFVLLLGNLLENHSYHVIRVHDSQTAWPISQAQAIDLIICDAMTLVNDHELITEIRNQPRWTPVICLSTKTEVQDRINGLMQGYDSYLGKPFEPTELVALIDALLRRYGVSRPFPTITLPSLRLTHCSFADLTPAQQRVLPFIVQGYANKQIAREMKIDQRTIESHISAILHRTGYTSRTELTRWLIEQHLL